MKPKSVVTRRICAAFSRLGLLLRVMTRRMQTRLLGEYFMLRESFRADSLFIAEIKQLQVANSFRFT
jgi:hypothetical protein